MLLPWLQRAQSDYDETCTKYELRLKEKNDEIQVSEGVREGVGEGGRRGGGRCLAPLVIVG